MLAVALLYVSFSFKFSHYFIKHNRLFFRLTDFYLILDCYVCAHVSMRGDCLLLTGSAFNIRNTRPITSVGSALLKRHAVFHHDANVFLYYVVLHFFFYLFL